MKKQPQLISKGDKDEEDEGLEGVDADDFEQDRSLRKKLKVNDEQEELSNCSSHD